ncbi:polymorphic toxin-type HINT domain-containing protein [Cellulomonas sp. NPDC057328]|uniref:polymorphic toxin-type HINT domain-containing protein n=1 Tax=Cellulomonas sp. NPDC057328 TaxID=3346101 RepID=UPI0036451714
MLTYGPDHCSSGLDSSRSVLALALPWTRAKDRAMVLGQQVVLRSHRLASSHVASKAISDVQVGDTVLAVAADGTTTYRQVVATITGHGAKDLVDLTLVGSGGGGPPGDTTITATDGHLFLTADGDWVPAGDLTAGDQLVEPDGTPVTLAATNHRSETSTVHNLTVDTDHTYTVTTTDGTDVVTHNDDIRGAMGDAQDANACPIGGGGNAANAVGAAREQRVADLVGGTVAKGPDGQDIRVAAEGFGRTGLDVLGPNGEYIFVGGPGKAKSLSRFGTALQNAKAAADQAGVRAMYYLEEGTPTTAVDLARKWFGDENVFTFPAG